MGWLESTRTRGAYFQERWLWRYMIACLPRYALIMIYNIDTSLCTCPGLVRLQQLFQATNNYNKTNLAIDTKRITSVDNGYELLLELHNMDADSVHRIILDVRTDRAEQIILRMVGVVFSNSIEHSIIKNIKWSKTLTIYNYWKPDIL